MGRLAITNRTVDKYFGFLKNLDNASKKRLIIKLTKSINEDSPKKSDLKSIFGAWMDENKDAESIIREIKDSRIEYRRLDDLE